MTRIEELAHELGCGWIMRDTPFGSFPNLVMTEWEGERLLERLRDCDDEPTTTLDQVSHNEISERERRRAIHAD